MLLLWSQQKKTRSVQYKSIITPQQGIKYPLEERQNVHSDRYSTGMIDVLIRVKLSIICGMNELRPRVQYYDNDNRKFRRPYAENDIHSQAWDSFIHSFRCDVICDSRCTLIFSKTTHKKGRRTKTVFLVFFAPRFSQGYISFCLVVGCVIVENENRVLALFRRANW